MMRYGLFLIFLLWGCAKEEAPPSWYVSGVVDPQDNQRTIAIWNAESLDSASWMQMQVRGTIAGAGMSTDLLRSNGGFRIPEDFQLFSSTTYAISCWLDGHELSTRFRMPGLIISADTSEIVLQTQSLPHVVEWSMSDTEEYAFLYLLRSLDANAQQSTLEGTRFVERFQGPQRSNVFELRPEDFQVMGSHELLVYAIPLELEAVFFRNYIDIRGLVGIGPDQVNGGKGFVAGIARKRWVVNFTP
jgi:hypothetical protein